MAEEMVERVARAMADRASIELGSPELLYDPAYVRRLELAGVDLRKLARAAIEEMREPTEAMVAAASATPEMQRVESTVIVAALHGITLPMVEWNKSAIACGYRAAITAALGKKGE